MYYPSPLSRGASETQSTRMGGGGGWTCRFAVSFDTRFGDRSAKYYYVVVVTAWIQLMTLVHRSSTEYSDRSTYFHRYA
jgi:hypothetical protein